MRKFTIFIASAMAFVAVSSAFVTTSALSAEDMGDFQSDKWQTDKRAWYIEWKRVRKYTRIAYHTNQRGFFPQFKRQARKLFLGTSIFDKGVMFDQCEAAALQLLKGLEQLEDGKDSGLNLTQASEGHGDRCIKAINGR